MGLFSGWTQLVLMEENRKTHLHIKMLEMGFLVSHVYYYC